MKTTDATPAEKRGVEMASATTVTDNDQVPSIHTLKTDAAHAWTSEKKTVLDLAAANENRRAESPIPNNHNVLRVVILVFFVSLLAAGGYFGYRYATRPDPIVIPPRPTPIVSGDADSTITLSSEQSAELTSRIRDLQKTRLAPGSLREVAVSFGADETTRYANRTTLLRLLGLSIPRELDASLSERFTLFLYYGAEDGMSFVFESTDARESFAGLLAWENSLLPSLASAFGTRAPLSAYDYRDELENNIDIRRARGSLGETFGGHAIVSGRIVVIASSEAALSRTLARVLQGPVQ